jgi:hypothetical protein
MTAGRVESRPVPGARRQPARGQGHPVWGGAMNGATVVRWGKSIPGRESKGLEVFGQAIEYFEGLSKTGRIHGHQEYISLTGREGGFMLVQGEVTELLRIVAEPETLKLNAMAGAIVEDFEIQVYGGGTDQAVQELVGTYSGALATAGYL